MTCLRRKEAFEKYIGPIPDELLKGFLPYAPRWQRVLWYVAMLLLTGPAWLANLDWYSCPPVLRISANAAPRILTAMFPTIVRGTCRG
jgi:hypothetical protein